jgi:hypothetical protein
MTTDIDFDVPEIPEGDVTWSYAAELERRSDGYTQFYGYGGVFYTGTLVWDGEASRNGWPENPWEPTTPLSRRLWGALVEDIIGRAEGRTENRWAQGVITSLHGKAKPWQVFDATPDHGFPVRSVAETEEDFEEARQKASMVLGDLIVFRRELCIKTGQPCYAVHIHGKKAKITVANTEHHAALRVASFDHPEHYPRERSNDRIQALRYYFAIEDREAMLAFVEASGAKIVGNVPRASRHRWANHDETIDGLELDRIARVALHEISLAFASSALYALPSVLLRSRREFFEAFYDLKEFLEKRHDPEGTSETLLTKLQALCDVAANRDHLDGLINHHLDAYLNRAIRRFGDRRITALDFLPTAGSLPHPG